MKVIKPLTFSNFGFERASEATYYNSSGILSVAAVDELREGYNPETLEAIGPIFENAATNIVPYSNVFTSGWTLDTDSDLGLESPLTTPGGGDTAFYMSKSAGIGSWGITEGLFLSTEGPYCFSTYFKVRSLGSNGTSSLTLILAGGGQYVSIRFNTNYASPSVILVNASAGQPANTTIQRVGNGWIRLSIAMYLASPATVSARILGDGIPSNDSNGRGFHYIWGAQVERGTTPTSFIYTEGAPETRAQDISVNTPPSVLNSNVDENEATTWAPATPYEEGDEVQVLSTYHRKYSALVDSTGDFPPTNPSSWLDLGSTNPWRMFNMSTGADVQTVSTAEDNSIRVELVVSRGVNSVVLLNVEASTVTIGVRDQEGNLVKSYTQDMLGPPLDTGWWDFFFGERSLSGMVVYTGFNLVVGGTISIDVEGGSSPAKVGKMIVGQAQTIGCAKFGTSAGIIDFSRKERDTFGNYSIVERRYIDKCEYDIIMDTDSAYEVKNFLASVRAIPAVYIGSENHLVTVVFGFFRDFSIVLQGPKKSSCSIQAEGI